MKETLILEPVKGNETILSIQYNHIIQAMLYNQLEEEISTFLHEEGFQKENRTYKMFTFSRLMGKFYLDKEEGKIIFYGPIKLTISSYYNEFSNSIGNNLLSSQTIKLGNNTLRVKELAVKQENIENNQIKIKTLSPIVTYSTLYRKDGKKFTYYFNPQEGKFSEIVSSNLKNKYKAYYLKDAPEEDVEIEPISKTKLSVVKYKDFVIKGYSGKFIMKGPVPLLQMGIGTGLGSKNSQGFGCVEVI
ncbi:CRISPR-associated endoribonuclease Cas6 [Schnuerera sp. xch1]|uniref:CRISPR-associated endoribonuclease Cas6 n=1 Tax=Schnuerera sp. xch1 TaxID=2874283 RepID=UPI001CBD6ECC|nr:CRISPR-associated endoribonuclease Cas6 [Schnuerera sp. xch1]MBZ2175797.1 CRISPR-associated endoribonuclease Cas6 [Schnuerera sp. xch1]